MVVSEGGTVREVVVGGGTQVTPPGAPAGIPAYCQDSFGSRGVGLPRARPGSALWLPRPAGQVRARWCDRETREQGAEAQAEEDGSACGAPCLPEAAAAHPHRVGPCADRRPAGVTFQVLLREHRP